MSDLQKRLEKSGLPPMPPSSNPSFKKRGFKRTYSPVPWSNYFDSREMISTKTGKFCVYKKGNEGPLLLCLHGGGFSALSWSVFADHVTKSAKCQLIAFDQRGHGDTETDNQLELSIETLASDVQSVMTLLYADSEIPPVIVIGHSMGGSVAIHASKPEILPTQIGLIVIDVVEGSAMEALAGMKQFIRSRPTQFKSLEHAIEWSIRSGQIKNADSACVSMIGQVKKVGDDSLTPYAQNNSDPLQEEPEDGVEAANSSIPAPTPPTERYGWRVDLEKTEQYWQGWFAGMSSQFLAVPFPKVLILAGVDRLDKELSIGQMQGKFQMQVIGKVGHVVHEDAPDQVAQTVATYLVRNKFAEQGEEFQRVFPAC